MSRFRPHKWPNWLVEAAIVAAFVASIMVILYLMFGVW